MADQEFTIEKITAEDWRDIPGYEGYYSVSNLGRVRRDVVGRNGMCRPGRLIKPEQTVGGYLRASLCRDGEVRRFTVHSLVASAFIGPRSKGMTINHIDANKINNRAENLEYLSCGDNIRHAARLGLYPTGDRHHMRIDPTKIAGERDGNSKLTTAKVLEIHKRYQAGEPSSVLAVEFNISRIHVCRIGKGEAWGHILPRRPATNSRAKKR